MSILFYFLPILTFYSYVFSHYNNFIKMLRPPRAPIKPAKLTSVAQCVTTNPSRKSVRPGRLLQIAISRFSADHSGKSDSKTKNKGKSTQDSQTYFCQYGIDDKKQSHERGRTSPKYGLENVQPNRIVGMRVGGFKIRHLSAHGRRSKQNIEPNLQRVQIDEQVQQVTLKQYISQPPQSQQITQLKSSILQSHPLQAILPTISTRAYIMEIQSKKQQSKTCIIISEYLISSAENKLIKIPNPHNFSIAIRVHSGQQIAELQSAARESNNNITYLLSNSDKYVSTHNVLNIKKLVGFENIISISDKSQFGMDVYTGITSAKYAYFALNSFEQLCKFMAGLNVVEDDLSQCGDNFVKIAYNINFDNCNKTKEYFENRQIREKIDLIRPQINSNERPSSSHIMKQFDQQFRQKMIQFAKLLHSQSQKPNTQPQYQYQYQSQYMKIVLPKQISQVLQTSSGSTSTTSYQLVSELIRNNGFNCKQIIQFRSKWK